LLREKKSRTARVSAVRLGGGGNEACFRAILQSQILSLKFETSDSARGFLYIHLAVRPGLVQPAERLRAVLSVGTNRAPLTVFFFFTNTDFIFSISTTLTEITRAKPMPDSENRSKKTKTAEFGLKTSDLVGKSI
jgi:hypothetical protein